MTYEIFMTAVVKDQDVAKARSVLTGVTECRERHRYTKISHMERQDREPKSLDKFKELGKETRHPDAPRWQELHQTLLRTPYVMQMRVDVTSEFENRSSPDAATTIPPSRPRTLRWENIPDPPSERVPDFLHQRRALGITNPDIPNILSTANFKPKMGILHETYHWWLDSAEYVLTKTHSIPAAAYSQEDMVPAVDSTTPLGDFWILHVRVHVESKPEQMRNGQERLVQAHQRLLGIFKFEVFDRRVFDTRVE
ncbi:hypothetical protein QBC39DRAFT_359657 [Podospora conica]|nr:hypothetical protein QBC39DRAFT_359657 [Schizothecium conicum]